MCLTGTIPAERGRPGSRLCSLSEHPVGRDEGMESGERRRSGGEYFMRIERTVEGREN